MLNSSFIAVFHRHAILIEEEVLNIRICSNMLENHEVLVL